MKWCQCLRRYAWCLLSNCWNDVSVWENLLNFYCPTVKMMSSVWEYVLNSIVQLFKLCQCLRRCANFYCVTVEMMSVCEKMCSMSIVQLLKLCQCLRRISSMSIVQLLKLCQCLRWCAQFLLFNCWNDVSVWEDVLDVYCITVEMMSVFKKLCLMSIVQLLKWCQCFRWYARCLLSYCWNNVSVWEYVLISIVQLLKWCQCLRMICSMYIVQLLKWCQCVRRCAQLLLSNCWNDVSVWEDVLNFYCLTVEMMSVFENMC